MPARSALRAIFLESHTSSGAPEDTLAAMHDAGKLERTLTLPGALTLNLLDMIGAGPFITLPILMAAMGGPQAMLGWICGALLALCDGMVWAELGAAMPEAGGTYQFLRRLYPREWGRWLSFVFVFQLCISAPLSIASGAIGLGQYAGVFHASSPASALQQSFRFGVSPLFAVAAIIVAATLLYRRLGAITVFSRVMLGAVGITLLATYITALLRGHAALVAVPHRVDWHAQGFWLGLGSAMLVATYDYWGYYNVTFLGGEARDAARTVPRAVLLSICIVAFLYLLLNVSMLSVLPSSILADPVNGEVHRAMLSVFMRTAWTPVIGAAAASWLGRAAAVMVMVTAFASIFALLLGYSRIPYAAARDGEFPRIFGALHPTRKFPHVSLLALAAAACAACFFSLAQVIASLVVLRVCLQFLLQHVGLMLWRRREPDASRPFRVWLYPLPPLAAIAGFIFLVAMRPHVARQIGLAALVAVVATAAFLWRRRTSVKGTGSFL